MESKLLNFLRSFPAWLVLAILFIAVLVVYIKSGDMFFQRVLDTVLGALIGILTGRGVTNALNANKVDAENLSINPENGDK